MNFVIDEKKYPSSGNRARYVYFFLEVFYLVVVAIEERNLRVVRKMLGEKRLLRGESGKKKILRKNILHLFLGNVPL